MSPAAFKCAHAERRWTNAAIAMIGAWILLSFSLAFGQVTKLDQASQASATIVSPKRSAAEAPADVLTADQWLRVDVAVDRALLWLTSQQQADGSFPTLEIGQPGVTSLCTMAFIAHGHVPSDGRYGNRIENAAEFVMRCQKQNGLVTLLGPEGPRISRSVARDVGVCAAYNHAISSLVIAELYGVGKLGEAKRLESAIEKSLTATLEMQRWHKDREEDKGGWRYISHHKVVDSDLSITGWQLMFLRSARNGGFNVPKKSIDDAVAYVRRCYAREFRVFEYTTGPAEGRSRGAAGAGILALAHAGFHRAPEATFTGNWILAHDFAQYNVCLQFDPRWVNDRYHYGLFNCCQGMYQLGGRQWEQFYPPVVETLLENQQPDGSWPAESHHNDARFGNAYTTALVLLTLGAPNQLLPIYQR